MIQKSDFNSLEKSYKILVFVILALILPAFFINIKDSVLIPDESLRTLVAFEMVQSGDYLTPKMGGEFYYKKPPVYNWLIGAYYKITGDYSEMGSRLPMLLSLLAFGLSIYLILRKQYGFRVAFLSATLYLIYPRTLTYESLYGLIDITYSWVVFLSFMAIYHYFQKQKYLSLFLISYALMALSFLMKGIPSIAYQGLTLLLVFSMGKKFWKLFSWQHLVGALLGFGLIATYYYAYYLRNPEQIATLLQTIFNESADKSGMAFGPAQVLLHALSFLLELLYTFLPASLIFLFFFHRSNRKSFHNDAFIRFLIFAALLNMSIYLISPITYMRYVLPHFALIGMAFVLMYAQLNSEARLKKILDVFFLSVAVLISLGQFAYIWIPDLQSVPLIWLKSLALSLPVLLALVFYYRKRKYAFEILILSMLMFKLGFNSVVVPVRTESYYLSDMRRSSLKAGEMMRGKKAILWNEGLIGTTHFYLSAGKQSIIPKSKDTTDIDYFIGYSSPLNYELHKKELVMEYKIEYTDRKLKIIKW